MGIWSWILLPALTSAGSTKKYNVSLSNVKLSTLGAIMYGADFNDKLPDATKWIDLTEQYAKRPNIFHSPGIDGEGLDRYGCAFRMYLSKRDMNVFNDPDRCPMIFDTILAGRSAAGNLDTLPNPGRFPGADGGRNTIGFLDGHVKLMTHAQVASKDADGKPLVR